MAAHYLIGMPVSSAGIAIWLIASVTGGPLYGLAGYWWRIGPGVRHVVGLALMGGVFIAEGVFTLIHDPLLPIVGWVAVGVGALFTIALARSTRDRLLGPRRAPGRDGPGAGRLHRDLRLARPDLTTARRAPPGPPSCPVRYRPG